jgi:hypothetical protein
VDNVLVLALHYLLFPWKKDAVKKCHQHLKEEENESELFGPIWSLLTKYGSTTENVDMW